jgi:PAS domain S-box-containing protein
MSGRVDFEKWLLSGRGYFLPGLIFLLATLASFGLYRVLVGEGEQFVKRLSREEADKVRVLIDTDVRGKLYGVRRMGLRWDAANGTPEDQWRVDARAFVAQLKGLRALEWVDASYHVRWIEPVSGNERAIGLDVLFDQERAQALHGAAARDTLTLTPPLDLVQGYRAFIAYTPVKKRGQFDGFIAGVFSVDDLFGSILGATSGGFALAIHSGGVLVFHSAPTGLTLYPKLGGRTSLEAYDKEWTLDLVPSEAVADRSLRVIPLATLVAGLLMALLLALTVRSMLLARLRARTMQETVRLNSAIASSTVNLLIATDSDGTIVSYNTAAERALGYRAADVIGRQQADLWLERSELVERAAELSEEFGGLVEPGFAVLSTVPSLLGYESRDWTFVRRDGTRFPARLTVTTLRESTKGITGYLATAEDITAQRVAEREREAAEEQLRLNEERHRLLIDGVSDYAIYWLDPKGTVTSWNVGARNLKGYSEEEIIGRNFSLFFTPEDQLRETPRQLLEAAARSGKYTGAGWRVRKDGSRFWANVMLRPIRAKDGSIMGFAKVSHDETARRDYEQRLANTLLELNAVLGALVDGLVIIDESHIIRTFTPSAERMFGYKAEEVVGQNVKILMAEPLRSEHDGYIDRYLATGEARVIGDGREVIGLRKGGATFPVELGVSTYQIGDSRKFVGILRDITARRRADEELRASEETFRNAMEAASIGMALLKPNGRWLKVNASLCEIVGYSEAELLANDFQSITHPDDLTPDLEQVRRLLSGEIQGYRMEKRYYHKSGRIVWVLLSASLVRDSEGQPAYFIAQIQDISEQKEAERIKSEFISVVSHELRTPLTSIRGSLGLILGGLARGLPERVTQLLQIAHTNCERLILLINDILDIDKIASGAMRFDLRPHSLAELTQQAVTGTEAYAQKFGVRFELEPMDPQIKVLVDEGRYIQVLSNLLSNAAKFSPQDTPICVHAFDDGKDVRVCVVDRGPGIPEEFRERIFERFSQADSSATRRAGGTGLGLHISRQIVERMSGQIGFDSEVGRGTTFWVEFPIVREKDETGTNRVLVASGLPAILHIEDDADLSRFLSEALRGRAEVTPATTLRKAQVLLEAFRFDMVILENRLRDGSHDLVRLLEDQIDPGVPVVLLCAAPPETSHERVTAVMVKTRVSERKIIDTILQTLPDVSPRCVEQV